MNHLIHGEHPLTEPTHDFDSTLASNYFIVTGKLSMSNEVYGTEDLNAFMQELDVRAACMYCPPSESGKRRAEVNRKLLETCYSFFITINIIITILHNLACVYITYHYITCFIYLILMFNRKSVSQYHMIVARSSSVEYL